MKKKLIPFIVMYVCLSFCVTNSFAFLGLVSNGVMGTVNAAYRKAYDAFMKAEMVKQTMIMMQNYRESKKYYAEIKRMRENKGGIGGYIYNDLKANFANSNKDIYWQFQYEVNRDPEDTAYVKKWMKKMDKFVKNKLDYSEEIYKIGVKRDKKITKLAEKSTVNLDEKKYDTIQLEAQILQLEFLSDINKNIQQLLRYRSEQQVREWELIRAQKIAAEKEAKTIKEMYENQQQQIKKDPYQIIQEMPK